MYVEWNDWIEISINEWFDSEIKMVNSIEISLPFSLSFWLFWDLSDKEENNREKEECNLSPISYLFWYEIKREWDQLLRIDIIIEYWMKDGNRIV